MRTDLRRGDIVRIEDHHKDDWEGCYGDVAYVEDSGCSGGQKVTLTIRQPFQNPQDIVRSSGSLMKVGHRNLDVKQGTALLPTQ